MEALLREILHEVKATRTAVESLEQRVGALEGQVAQLDERTSNLEHQVGQLREQTATLAQRIDLLDERTNETKAIVEALRHGQEVLTAKYEAMAHDLHHMKGDLTRITSVLEDKVLPALAEHEAGLSVLNARVFKTESALHRLVYA